MKRNKIPGISSEIPAVQKINDARDNILGGQNRTRAAIISIILAIPLCMLMDLSRGAATLLGGLTALTFFNAYECYDLRRHMNKLIDLIEIINVQD